MQSWRIQRTSIFVCCHGITVNYSSGLLVCSLLSQHQKSLSSTSRMALPHLKSLSHFPLQSNTLMSWLHSRASIFFSCLSPSFSLLFPFFLCVHNLLKEKIESQVCTHTPCSDILLWYWHSHTSHHHCPDSQHRSGPHIKKILCTTPCFQWRNFHLENDFNTDFDELLNYSSQAEGGPCAISAKSSAL